MGDYTASGNRLRGSRCGSNIKCCMCTIICLVMASLVMLLTLLFALVPLQSSAAKKIEIWNSDVVLVSKLSMSSSSTTTEIAISKATGDTSIQIYLSQCFVDTYFIIKLAVSESHRIDEPYLVKDSQLQYTFSTPEINLFFPCVALVYIFQNSTSYFEFVTNKQVSNATTTCLPSDSSTNITVSAENEDQYYFIGLMNIIPEITINYTVTGKLLRYNVTGLSPITCSLTSSSPNCSVPLQDLPSGEDVCIVGTLQPAMNNFTGIVVNAVIRNSEAYSVLLLILYVSTIISAIGFIIAAGITFSVKQGIIVQRYKRACCFLVLLLILLVLFVYYVVLYAVAFSS